VVTEGTCLCVLDASVISAVDDGVLLFRFHSGVSEAMRRPCVYRERAVDWSPQPWMAGGGVEETLCAVCMGRHVHSGALRAAAGGCRRVLETAYEVGMCSIIDPFKHGEVWMVCRHSWAIWRRSLG
jgi:hypothetical protein